MTSLSYALEVRNLRKVFPSKKGDVCAVSDISFSVKRGEICGLLGVNGAGKSTILQMLLGTLTPTSGTIKYDGIELHKSRSAILHRVGYIDGYSRMPGALTVWENLDVYGSFYGMRWTLRRQRIAEMLELFGISHLRGRKCNTLSAGQATRVALVKAFMSQPKVVLLDEPTASLDPEICADIRAFLIREKKERDVAMVYTSHNMAEVTEVCDRVIFLKDGVILEEDTPQNLARKGASTTLRLHVQLENDKQTLLKIANYRPSTNNEWIECEVLPGQVAETIQSISSSGIRLADIEVVKPSLEDFFIKAARTKEAPNELL